MANFVKLDNNNIVIEIHSVNNSDILDGGVESESKGIEFLKGLFGQETIWAQCSYSGRIRKNMARIGDYLDISRNAFISPKPYPSWILNEETCRHEAPIPRPENNDLMVWNEAKIKWDVVLKNE